MYVPRGAITFVFAVPSLIPWRGPGVRGHPFISVSESDRTYRLRYQFARPSAMPTPCTMPVPMNQWYVDGSSTATGLGPLRR